MIKKINRKRENSETEDIVEGEAAVQKKKGILGIVVVVVIIALILL